EGGADFIAELISGRHMNQAIHDWALPREAEIWARFSKVMDEEDHDGWLYGGDRPEGWPADVGYFVGYRIAQAYYDQAEDKRAALKEILASPDVRGLLARSVSRRFQASSRCAASRARKGWGNTVIRSRSKRSASSGPWRRISAATTGKPSMTTSSCAWMRRASRSSGARMAASSIAPRSGCAPGRRCRSRTTTPSRVSATAACPSILAITWGRRAATASGAKPRWRRNTSAGKESASSHASRIPDRK